MPSGLNDYNIDDLQSAEVNIQAFVDQLKSTDAKLADVLAPHLLPLSQGAVLDSAAILDALFTATQAAEQSQTGAEDSAA